MGKSIGSDLLDIGFRFTVRTGAFEVEFLGALLADNPNDISRFYRATKQGLGERIFQEPLHRTTHRASAVGGIETFLGE